MVVVSLCAFYYSDPSSNSTGIKIHFLIYLLYKKTEKEGRIGTFFKTNLYKCYYIFASL